MTEENKQKPTETPQEKLPDTAKLSFIDKVLAYLESGKSLAIEAWNRLQNLEKSNIEAGVYQLREGNFTDASLRFKFAAFLNKKNPIAFYLQGKSYVYAQKRSKAIAPLRQALKLDPEFNEAKFLLAVCGANKALEFIPRSLIIEKLDLMSNKYDDFMKDIGNVIVSAFTEILNKNLGDRAGINVLDINCRAGELAAILKPKANNVIGLEPALKLAGMARTRRDNNLLVFNHVLTKFPEDYLKETNEKFDVVLCGLYMDNFGKLDELFTLVKRVLADKGKFLFNINKIEKVDYAFMPNALVFGHSDGYIKKLLDKHGFKIVSAGSITYAPGIDDLMYLVEKI